MTETNTEINQAKMEIIQAKEELQDSIMQAQKNSFGW